MRCQTCPPFSPPPDSRHGRRFATRTTRSKPFPALPEEGLPRHAVEPRAQYRARFYGGSSSLFPPAAFRKFRHPGTNPVRPSQRRPPALAAYRAIQPPANNGKYARDRLQKNAAHQNYRPVPTRLAERSARHSALRTGRTAFVHFLPRYASAPAQLPRLTVRTKGVRMKRIRKKPSAIHSQTAFS